MRHVSERERAIRYRKKQIDVCPVIDHEVRHTIVKVDADPLGHEAIATLTML